MILSTMTDIATQPQSHKSFTSGNRAGTSNGQTRRLLRAFALLTIFTIAFYVAPMLGAEGTETEMYTCKLRGSSHIWSDTNDLILKAEVKPASSGGEVLFYRLQENSRGLIVAKVDVFLGKAQFNLGKPPYGYRGTSDTYYFAYVPPKGAPRRNGFGCQSNGWGVFVPR